MKTYTLSILFGIIATLLVVFLAVQFFSNSQIPDEATGDDRDGEEMPVLDVETYPYGSAVLTLTTRADFPNVTLRPIEIVEESRCPVDVTCVQEGTLRVRVEIVSGLGTSTAVVGLGEEITTEAEVIRLKAASPYPSSGVSIPDSAYQLTFEVQKRTPEATPVVPPSSAECYIGGCSGQLCTDQPGAISSCEYLPEYACYRYSRCERQQNGACGWTQTEALTSCIMNAGTW